MKTFIIEAAVALTLVFIAYRSIFAVLASKVEATARNRMFYLQAGLCGFPFAICAWQVFPHLGTALNFYERSDGWGKPIQYGGGYLLLIMAAGLLALFLAHAIFKIVSREQSVTALIKSPEHDVLYLLCGMIITSGIIVSVLAGEIAAALIPFDTVPYSF